MAELHQHPDGLIYVRTDAGTYCDTPENFVLDFNCALPSLDDPSDERIYSQDRRHCYMFGGDVVGGGPMPWQAGDDIIASIDDALAAQATRLAPPPAPPVDLSAYAAAARYTREVGGTVVAGVPIATDDRSKQMLLGARVAADANPSFETPWVGADGTIYPLTGAQVIGISNAVLAHVGTCFAIFASVKAGIDAGSITTTAEIDAAFA